MRITGGKARGIRLKSPSGAATRPATDRMREAVFSSLGPSIEGAQVADLFAGTGAYGLEALSRGAAAVTFFEKDRAAISCLKANIAAVLRSAGREQADAAIVTGDLLRQKGTMGRGRAGLFDFIFADPPYELSADPARIVEIFSKGIDPLATEATSLIFEHAMSDLEAAAGWKIQRNLGKKGPHSPTVSILLRSA